MDELIQYLEDELKVKLYNHEVKRHCSFKDDFNADISFYKNVEVTESLYYKLTFKKVLVFQDSYFRFDSIITSDKIIKDSVTRFTKHFESEINKLREIIIDNLNFSFSINREHLYNLTKVDINVEMLINNEENKLFIDRLVLEKALKSVKNSKKVVI